jgi:hypothetical protein
MPLACPNDNPYAHAIAQLVQVVLAILCSKAVKEKDKQQSASWLSNLAAFRSSTSFACIYILRLFQKPIQSIKPRKFSVLVQAEWRFFALLYFNKNVSEQHVV